MKIGKLISYQGVSSQGESLVNLAKNINMKLVKLEIIVEKSKEDSIKHLSVDLNDYLNELNKKNVPMLFLSSGGSALSVLEYIHIPMATLGENLTVGVLDERFDITNKNSNFAQLSETHFYKELEGSGVEFIDTRVKPEQTQEQLTQYFEEEVRKWKEKNPDGKIVVTAGVGSDGHTAGIMPMVNNTELFTTLFEGSKLVIGYKIPSDKFSERVTTTMTFLRMIDKVFVLMLGEEKAHAFFSLQNTGGLNEIPARIWKEVNGSLYVDQSVIKG